jgi:hypothetical protein
VTPDPRLVTIGGRLLALTRAGRQRWQATPRPGDTGDEWQPREFQTGLEHGTALIASRDPEGHFPYVLRIVDPMGQEAARLETGQDAESWLGDREADAWEQGLADLYATAREATLHSEAAVDAILSELAARD